ncbi:MAG: 1-phosphofructokinase family hexose kinase [Solobacterium sp.]|nr:1-phosphofructokinase family hexose kinase [Solobacterium sp.]
MICTCTMNPSLDYYMEFETPPKAGMTNRSQLEYYEAGGKGINVSIVLSNLQIPTRATGFVGGFTRDFFITLLQKYEYLQPNFTYINGHTRINVKLSDNENETDLNAAGPYITSSDMENLMSKVVRLTEGDYFVLGGVCPEHLHDQTVEMLVEGIEDGVRVVLDTNSSIIRDILPHHPFLIKTSEQELGEFRHIIMKRENVIEAVGELREKGAQNVIVLLDGAEEAVFGCESGIYSCDILHDRRIVSTVGVGDSLTAGFLMNYLRSRDAVESFRFACCCGIATAYTKGFATRDKIEKMYDQTSVVRIG